MHIPHSAASSGISPVCPTAYSEYSDKFDQVRRISIFVPAMQHIPGWWIGAYWMNPVTWSLYGLVVSNLGDEDNNIVQLTDGGTMTVPEFLRNRFGYRHEWEGWVVIVLAAFAVFFWGAGALAFKKLNFQQR